jgi:hypothetical protein
MPQGVDRWPDLVKIHNHAKVMFIVAEERDLTHSTYIQPISELKNALDHIVRAKSAELGINGNPENSGEEYINQCIEKAIGHAYRAFFDSADWLSVSLRDRIESVLAGYSSDCIKTVIPDYYSKYKPRADKICCEIAKIRNGKDVSKGKDLLDEVEKYRVVVEELIDIDEKISNSISSLIDLKNKSRREKILQLLLAASIGACFTAAVKWIIG